ncbi:MAG: archease [Candidatus Eisenbacteria bacterium]
MSSDSFYETIEHTADIGIEVEAPESEGLFARCALAMFDMMFGLESIERNETRRITVSGENLNELLVAWLNDLLYVYSVEGMMFSDFSDIVLGASSLSALGLGETFDQRKHSADLEIKAATYHGLSVEQAGGKWRARVIFDI